MIVVCWWRYSMKASLVQRPKDFMTSNGIPLSWNSRVPPMWIPCPLRLSSPSIEVILLILSKKTFLVNGCKPFACLYVKRGPSTGGLFIQKWCSREALGSVIPFCCDQNTSSPSDEHLAFGRWKTMTSKLFWSSWLDMLDGLTCCVGQRCSV